MEIPPELNEAISRFDQLGKWDRAELGRQLRRLGLSYGEIKELIDVPKGTLAGWCRDVPLTPEQARAIKERTGSQLGVPRDTQWRRRAEIERIQKGARQIAVDHLADPFWVAGTVLYWSEGSKTTRRLELANSDPHLLRLFITWVEEYLDPRPNFVLWLVLHADNDEPAARRFWTTELRLNQPDFYKSTIKADGTGHRKNHLAHGVCRVGLRRSTDAFLRTMTWIQVVASRWTAIDVGETILAPGR